MARRTGLALGATAAWAGALAVNRSLRRVRGTSMAPTLRPGDLLVVVPGPSPRPGRVVVVRDPRAPDRVTVKRVVATAGQHLSVRAGRARVDGTALSEPHATGAGPDAELLVPAGHVAVLGDARDASTDSRVFGPVPLALVDGVVVARVHPDPLLLVG